MKRIYSKPGGSSGTGIGLWIFRGLPGSGKTTQAKAKVALYGGVHLEADQYFERGGDYSFDPEKLKDAHEWCQEETRKRLSAGDMVAVSNTFTQLWEMNPYLEIARELKIPVVVTHCCEEYGSIHDVPEHTIKRMRDRFEHYPGEDHIYPQFIYDELRYYVARDELEYADNFRAYRVDDGWLKESYKAVRRQGCCGYMDTRIKYQGQTWAIGCNYGH